MARWSLIGVLMLARLGVGTLLFWRVGDALVGELVPGASMRPLGGLMTYLVASALVGAPDVMFPFPKRERVSSQELDVAGGVTKEVVS